MSNKVVLCNTYTITNWWVSLSKICYEWPNNTVTHECAHLRDVKMFVVIPVFFLSADILKPKF
jgi:hypothetical protein